MSDQPQHGSRGRGGGHGPRGGRGGQRHGSGGRAPGGGRPGGSDNRGGRGGSAGSRGGGSSGAKPAGEGRRREFNIDLQRHLHKKVHIKFVGGRQVVGVLKGFDSLHNVVLGDAVEYCAPAGDHEAAPFTAGETRQLGTTVARGVCISFISPYEGFKEISDPFGAS